MTLSGPFLKKRGDFYKVLIPLLVDDPLRVVLKKPLKNGIILVLIPLLVDDPLRVLKLWNVPIMLLLVLIPLLVDDPLREVLQN